MSVDFFAVREDFESLFLYLWQETDCRVAEAYSAFDQELRWFEFFDELEASFRIGEDPHGNGHAAGLVLWSPSVMPRYRIERIALDQRRVKGHTHRYTIRGVGLMTLQAGGRSGEVITRSQVGHISQKRAIAYGATDVVDWPALAKLGRKIEYHIRKRIAAGKTLQRSLPILAGAYRLALGGSELRETRGSPWEYQIDTGSR